VLKAMLIGDSIRHGYQDKVAELLKGKANVAGPEANCAFSALTLFHLSSWVAGDDYDVIQWNNGQWDTCHMPDGKIHTPLTSYLELQERIAGILMKKTRRLIFATTTPVWPEQFANASIHPRRNEDIDAYNSAAVDLMGRLGVEVNDLNSPIKESLKQYISDDMVHLSEDGARVCAELVAAKIEGADERLASRS
jgi:hypothetical protein